MRQIYGMVRMTEERIVVGLTKEVEYLQRKIDDVARSLNIAPSTLAKCLWDSCEKNEKENKELRNDD